MGNGNLKYACLVLAMALAGTSGCLAKVQRGLDDNDQLQLATRSRKVGGLEVARLQDGVQIRIGKTVKNIVFYGPETVRVNANLGKPLTQYPSLVVVDKPAAPELKITESDGGIQIAGDKLTIKVDGKTAALTFMRPDGSVMLRENAQEPSEIKQVDISGAPTYEVKQRFTLGEDESLYGLGQYDDRYMDYRGQKVLLIQTNIGIVIPFLISTQRYGIMWDAYSETTFTDNADGATFWSESSPAGVDYYFMAGDTMDGVIAGYRRLTGPAPMLSKKFFGLFMCKERYTTQDRLLEVVRNFRKAQFPLDTIVQDWQYWGGADGSWSGMIWTPDRFPDPAGTIKTLHEDLNVNIMCSIWPSVGNDTALARELDQYGLRFEPLHWISRKARIYDAFSEKGREIYFKHIKKGLLDVGVDALWMDGTEVEVGGACHNARGVANDIKNLGINAMGDFTRYLNVYSLVTTQGTYEGQRATGNKRVFTLTRSAYTGQQRYAALSWSGDTVASWDTLRNQVAGGLNVCMAGQPYWTQDIGGFFVHYPNGERNPAYRELYARWNQFGIFNPIYRIHGTSIEREPYIFKDMDPEMYDSMLDAAHLRYRLIPYIYGLAWQSTANGYTMMRGMAMDFPDDRNVRKLDNQFMFGPALLARIVDRAIYHTENEAPKDLVPGALLQTPDGRKGIAVQYYRGRNFETEAGKSVESEVNTTWPGPPLTDLPPGLDRLDDFSTRWEGVLTIPETGEYEIGTVADDGSRLWVDGTQIVDDWTIHPMQYRGKKLSFTKGQRVHLKIEYFQGGGDRGLRLVWKTPDVLAKEMDGGVDDQVATYLPAGTWYDFWTNEKIEGGKAVERACPLDIFPLYVRAGSIIPMSPVMQYVDEQPDAPYEIRIYPGADATFTIYEDDGVTYNYEKGEYATVELMWNDAGRTLTIGERKGSFPELVKEREFRVVLATPDAATGIDEPPDGFKEVPYNGRQLVIEL